MTSIVGLLVEFKAQTSQVDAAFRNTEKKTKDLAKAAENTNSTFAKLGSSLKGYLAGFATIAVAVQAFRGINNATIEFSKSLADLSAITGATGKDLKFLEQASKEFGRTTLSNASQVAEAFKLVGSVKADLLGNLPALKAVTKEVITLSQASGIDLKTAADVVGASLNQFGADANQANRFVNVLAAGSKFGAAEVNDLGEALKYSGTVASQAGLSFEQTTAALEGLAMDALKGSEAGTGLRGVLIHLQKQANSDFNPAIVGLNKALDNLAAANLTVAQKTKMFGVENITAANSLIKNREAIKQLTRDLTGSQVAYEQSAIVMDSYAAKVQKLSNAWNGLEIAIGNSAESKKTIDGLTEALNNLSEGIDQRGLVGGILIGPKPVKGESPSAGDILRMQYGVDRGGGYGPPVLESQIPAAPTPADFQKANIQDSFIAPIISAGTQLEKFAETTQQASARLQNAFTNSFGDPAKKVADQLIGKLGQNEQDKFNAAAQNIDPSFLKQTQEAAALVSQAQYTKSGEERNRILAKLDSLQESLNQQAFQGGAVGDYAVGTKNGGTFSVTGPNGANDEQQRVMQAIIGDLNKFVAQQLNTEQRVKVIITINDPSKPEWIKWMQGETEKQVKNVTKKAAQQGAK